MPLDIDRLKKAIRFPDGVSDRPLREALVRSASGRFLLSAFGFGEEDLPYDIKAPAFTVEDIDYGTWFADASEYPERYQRKKITFLAQLYRPFGMAKNVFIPGRKVMACCPADVQFYGFPCKTDKPFRFSNNSWQTVTVEFGLEKKKEPRTGNPVQVPVLHLVSAEPAEAPAEEIVTL